MDNLKAEWPEKKEFQKVAIRKVSFLSGKM